ncbi:MAG: hypothetical protein IH586_14100 [Anaerolineaceae bacterium]|nr:hypothetical protein [Anaerolineaceae bacterium]
MNTRRLILLVVLSVAWYVLSALALAPGWLLAVALLGLPGMLAAAWFGRRALDRQPTPDRALEVTAWVHDAVIALLGSASIAATRLFRAYPGWVLPVPESIGLALVILSGLLLLASTSNLILSGLGIPVAILPTRRLATDWLYKWTRNPIVLSALLFLVCLGLWLRSAWLVAWTVLLVAPTSVGMLRLFEERELEIRFGAEYLSYKAQVPMLFPRILSRTRQHPGNQPS